MSSEGVSVASDKHGKDRSYWSCPAIECRILSVAVLCHLFFLFWVVQGDISVFCCLKVTYFFVILLFFIQSVKFISIIRLLITTNFPNSCHCVCLIIPSLKYQTTNLKRTLFHPHTNQTKSTFHNIQKSLHTITNFFKILLSLTAYSSRRCIED